MKKKTLPRIAAYLMALTLAGCTAGNNTATTAEDASMQDVTADTEDSSGTEEPFETKEFFDVEAYLSAVNVEDYVTLGDYKGLEVTLPETTVDENELEYMYSYYESQMAPPVEVTGRALQEGDIAQLDYSGRIKETDEVFEGGTAEGQTLEIGSGSFIEGFESGMVGMEIGETRELELQFPDPYYNNEELSGVPVIFTVTLNGIQTPGAFTDDVVKDLGIEDVETVEQFRTYLENRLQEEAKADSLAQVESLAAGLATENATFAEELPAQLLERYVYMLGYSAYMQAQSQGIPTEDLIRQTMLMDDYEGEPDEYVRKRAEDQVKELLVYEAVARAENLGPSKEELTEAIAEILLQTGYETVEDYEKSQGILLQDAYRENLTAQAARTFLAENAKVTYE